MTDLLTRLEKISSNLDFYLSDLSNLNMVAVKSNVKLAINMTRIFKDMIDKEIKIEKKFIDDTLNRILKEIEEKKNEDKNIED